ncbi:molybdopterin molybdotransferase MoeA [Thalassococcus lentus]|uniref:Molybdopterin molybdenumtransferase n=1 Tax=Thalassococcus lentus TaxID=1210524 RepID=A0ABT4XRI6_9RHOB|nr:gephyrin-like molybdotransferase Glp [Thalassococcus lentus]MDA7424566.1 molybdopterin molybdotransferase MoeA [Thalassococcus lentus]
MITVTQALEQLFSIAPNTGVEDVPLLDASGRVLAKSVQARREQPPFAASAMDGYAVQEASPGDILTVIGESAAGHRFEGAVAAGEAVRIFTGAPVPEGANRVVIQEDVQRNGDTITIGDNLDTNVYIRPSGGDFHIGDSVAAPRLLDPQDVALLASMNIAQVPVARKPVIALISTGDELVMPGDTPGPDQIIASNTFGLHALMRNLGAEPRLLPIARDNEASLKTVISLAEDADLIVTIGGASVGDHDLVASVTSGMGLDRAFHKVAMRPGKPLMSGRLGETMMIGLPGNPVSAMVCGHIFVAPVVRAMMGLPAVPAPRQIAPLGAAVSRNGPREHYMRARLRDGELQPFGRQDSSLLSILGEANALIVRPVDSPALDVGEQVEFISI